MTQSTTSSYHLRFAVDIGGTFTDGVAVVSPGGRIWVGKTLTTPSDPSVAVSTVLADLARQMALSYGNQVPPASEVVHGTTLVTNTLIERKGARTGLVVTRGTRDVLSIAREIRYDLYDLNLEMPSPLVPDELRVEVNERVDARGQVIEDPDETEIARLLKDIEGLNVESVALCFLHSYVNDVHEKKIAAAIRDRLPGISVSISSGITREIREYERMSTAVCNAYVQPVVREYLNRIDTRVHQFAPDVSLRIMVSSGGFTSADAAARNPIMLLESGPAGGVISAVNTGRNTGVANILAFDMGGTTAKACVAVDGEPLIAHSFECARVSRFKRGSGLPILTPSIDLIEIGAGGGSIAHINDLGLLNVGPESSGAEPGPACYGRGGTRATVTDADLVLGYLGADSFLGGTMPLRVDLAERALQDLAELLNLTSIQVAWGIANIVNENMAAAARIHIAEKGHDPRMFTMVATGGAGPVHVIEVARKLRIPHVLAPIAAGAGSCLGLLAAPARVDRSWSNPTLIDNIDWSIVTDMFVQLRADADAELRLAGVAKSAIKWWIGADIRYAGQGHSVAVAIPWRAVSPALSAPIAKEFERRYRQLYGQLVPSADLEVMTWRLTGRSATKQHRFTWGDARADSDSAMCTRRKIYLPLKGKFESVPVYDRYSLAPGTKIVGPVILQERESTLVVPIVADVLVLPDYTVSVTLKEFE